MSSKEKLTNASSKVAHFISKHGRRALANDRVQGALAGVALVVVTLALRRRFTRSKKLNFARSKDAAPLSVITGSRIVPESKLVEHRGRCHCGDIRFVLKATVDVEAFDCNCTICTRKGRYPHLVVPASRFELLSGMDNLSVYTFGSHTAKHMFCSRCGVYAFHIPRSNVDGFDINMYCLDPSSLGKVVVYPFDGERWDEAIDIASRLGEEAMGSPPRHIPTGPSGEADGDAVRDHVGGHGNKDGRGRRLRARSPPPGTYLETLDALHHQQPTEGSLARSPPSRIRATASSAPAPAPAPAYAHSHAHASASTTSSSSFGFAPHIHGMGSSSQSGLLGSVPLKRGVASRGGGLGLSDPGSPGLDSWSTGSPQIGSPARSTTSRTSRSTVFESSAVPVPLPARLPPSNSGMAPVVASEDWNEYRVRAVGAGLRPEDSVPYTFQIRGRDARSGGTGGSGGSGGGHGGGHGGLGIQGLKSTRSRVPRASAGSEGSGETSSTASTSSKDGVASGEPSTASKKDFESISHMIASAGDDLSHRTRFKSGSTSSSPRLEARLEAPPPISSTAGSISRSLFDDDDDGSVVSAPLLRRSAYKGALDSVTDRPGSPQSVDGRWSMDPERMKRYLARYQSSPAR